MPSKMSGRIVKSTRRGKRSTPHTRNHRWESFTTKISKLHSLDPLRKVRRYDLDAEDLSTATSYFHQSLCRWTELNLSRSFVAFRREAQPLCESLPQILHHDVRLMDLLAGGIAATDREALEPLLDLTTAFAHDLGPRFERHYPRVLALVADVLSAPQDPDVVEWAFGALAFLFKYLSRLLVPDLRPTYDVLAPLLGRERCPPYVARFAAEAFSFLVKKAAAPSIREVALAKIVAHVRDDLCRAVGNQQQRQQQDSPTLYQDGVMTLFAEALKGTGDTLHSTAPALIKGLMEAIQDDEMGLGTQHTWTNVVCGVLTSTLHCCSNPTNLEELMAVIVEHIRYEITQRPSCDAQWRSVPWFRILGTLCGVRRGSKVSKWQPVVTLLVDMIETLAEARPEVPAEHAESVWRAVVVNVALVWQHAPIDSLISNLGSFVRAMTREPLMGWFIPFCAYLDELDPARFSSLLRKELQKFIASQWSDGRNEEMLCVLLPRISQAKETEKLRLPQAWQDQIVSKFERLEIYPFPERGAYDKDPQTWRDVCLPKYSALFRVLEATAVHPSTSSRIADLVLRKLRLALRPSSTIASDDVHFIIGQGFKAYLRMAREGTPLDLSLGPLLRASVARFCQSVAFLEAILTYEQLTVSVMSKLDHQESSSNGSEGPAFEEEDPVLSALIRNLASPSHALRLISLKLLQHLDPQVDGRSCLEIMMQIEELPLDLSNARIIGMHMRKIVQLYASSINAGSWLRKAVPAHVFGMLTVKMSPVWDDSVTTLKQLSKTKEGEDVICDLAFQWLDTPSPRWTPPQNLSHSDNRQPLTAFDCTHYRKLTEAAERLVEVLERPENIMLQSFDAAQKTAEPQPTNARAQALKVFVELAELAEKRSRRLVPGFLSWASSEPDSPEPVEEGEPSSSLVQPQSWSLADRKALMVVFGKFTNPRALYRHEKVYAALLESLKNGDTEVQKLALKAIFTWKQDGVKPYHESLFNLVDEAKFKNALTVMFQGEEEIKPQHRGELMPILLRILYGRSIAKKGVASGRHGLLANRLAVIRNLTVEDMNKYIDIVVGKLKDVGVLETQTPSGLRKKTTFDEPVVPIRNQLGFLNMITSIVSELGHSTVTYVDTLVGPVLYCLICCCRQLGGGGGGDHDEEETEDVEVEQAPSNNSLVRATRTAGLKCLNLLFQNAQSFDWTPYRQTIMDEVVAPRMQKLPTETAQGASGLLKLFSTWSALPKSVLFMIGEDDRPSILPRIIECLGVGKGKDEVKVFVLGIIRNLITLTASTAAEYEFNELIGSELIEPNADAILTHLAAILKNSATGNVLLEACIETIIELSPLLERSDKTPAILSITTYLLEQPARRVSPRTKGRVLLVVERCVALLKRGGGGGGDEQENARIIGKLYETLSSLFGYFRDRENRESLARIFIALADNKPDILEVARLVTDLNSFVKHRIDELDYTRRLGAFTLISKDRDTTPLNRRQWLPILHNFLFYIHADEEFGVLSSNSADGLRRFVEDVARCRDEDEKQLFEKDMRNVLLPALYAGSREQSDTARREVLRVFGRLISCMPTWEPIADLQVLLEGTDNESIEPPFFFHILSPATSRQLEALRLLEKANARTEMSSHNLSQFFIPLLEHFAFARSEGSDDSGLGAQAADTIGALAASLQWKHYRTLLQRYISYIESKPDWLKRVNRMLGRVSDALILAIEQKKAAGVGGGGEKGEEKGGEKKEEIAGVGEEEEEEEEEEEGGPDQISGNDGCLKKALARSLPPNEKLDTDIMDWFVPSLVKHLHQKDESEVSYRVPVGVIIVKMLKMVPEEKMKVKLAGVLTDICHILRSKSVESRDMARESLVRIASILGPSFFSFLLKELKGALTRGPQLHVLSFTVHAILVSVVPEFSQGDLDPCLPTLVTIIMDDIFGVTGQEKEAEGYTTQMKEIKSSKSQDSMELIAKNASIEHLGRLIRPLQSLLSQKIDLKIARKIDTLLTRIASGLLQNRASSSRDTLVFCYEVIQEFYNGQGNRNQYIDPKLKKYLVRKGAGDKLAPIKHTQKLVRFAVDILRSVLKKHDNLRTESNITGLIPILGDLIVAGQGEVKSSAFRLLAAIPRVPFKTEDDINALYKVAAREAIRTVSQASSTATDLAQSALKLISVILRDRREVQVKDAAIDMLLSRLKDDLTQPLYRHVTFNLLRCVLDRKIETAAVYDTADYVGTIMVTNDDKDTRDLARGAFFQFLREYPQKKTRWAKQLNFIVANLKYEREGGRLSVMEVVHLLLIKSADGFAQEVTATCFLPLVFVLANDDSERCRAAAAELVREIFRRADRERMQKFLTLLRSWVEAGQNASVTRLAIEVLGIYFEAREAAAKDGKSFELLLEKVAETLKTKSVFNAAADEVNTALDAVRILTDKFPARLLGHDNEAIWDSVAACFEHGNGSVQLNAVKLITVYLGDFAKNVGSLPGGGPGNNNSMGSSSLQGSYGSILDGQKIQSFVRLGLSILDGIDVNAEVASETAQVLVFLGPRLGDDITLNDDDTAESEGLDSSDAEDEEVMDEALGMHREVQSVEGAGGVGHKTEAYERRRRGVGGLHYVLHKLSSIIRKEVPPRSVAIRGKVAAMEVLETICRRLPAAWILPSLGTILAPLHHLTDPSIPPPQSHEELFRTLHDGLRTRAEISMDALQKKVGTAEYSRRLLAVREGVKARRQRRSGKRKIEAVSQPEKYGRDKRVRSEKKRERRKVKGQEGKERRMSHKVW